MPARPYLAGGLSLTPDDRALAESLLAQLRGTAISADTTDARKHRLAILTKMLLTYPVAGASSETGKARAEAYLEALDDIPPWAIANAVRVWHRGEAGDHDYRWAPAPAVLRVIARSQSEPLKPAIEHLEKLLAAVPIDDAMREPTPEERAYVISGFDKLKADLDGKPQREAAE